MIRNEGIAHGLWIVNTGDWHLISDAEISDNPDFKITYPPHCMQNSPGAEFVPATSPINPTVISWDHLIEDPYQVLDGSREIVIYKNQFDCWTGSPHTTSIVDVLKPDRVIAYGVATNVCVNFAVMGHVTKGTEVYVVTDAIKDLPHLTGTDLDTDKLMSLWKHSGVRLITTEEVKELL